jgi:asparagine N-glycosylation enzyme membrane subunit Stt3
MVTGYTRHDIGRANPFHAGPRPTNVRQQIVHRETTVFHRSDYAFIIAAFLSFLFSVYLWFSGQREEGLFVGIWVPSILGFATLVAQAKAR